MYMHTCIEIVFEKNNSDEWCIVLDKMNNTFVKLVLHHKVYVHICIPNK